MFGAAFISFPVIATQIYMFVAPASIATSAGLPAVSGRDAVLLRARRDGGLFHRDADAGALLARHAAVGGEGQAEIALLPKVGEYLVADDVAGLRLRHRVPAAGDPDLLGRVGIITSETAAGQAALFHRRRLRHRGGADAARRDQPALARGAADGALRGLDLVGADGRRRRPRPPKPPRASRGAPRREQAGASQRGVPNPAQGGCGGSRLCAASSHASSMRRKLL